MTSKITLTHLSILSIFSHQFLIFFFWLYNNSLSLSLSSSHSLSRLEITQLYYYYMQQRSFNPHWSTTPLYRFPPPSLARFNSPPPPLSLDSPRPPPGSPPPPPPPPPDSPPPPPPSPDSPPPPPPSPPPGFTYRPPPPPGFSYRAPPPPRQVFNFPAVPSSEEVPTFRDHTAVSSVVSPPQRTPEMRATRSRDHLFQPISLPNSSSRKGQASGSGGRRRSTPVGSPPSPESPPPPPPGVDDSPTPLQVIRPPLFLPPPPPPPIRPVCRLIVPNPPICPIRSPTRKKTASQPHSSGSQGRKTPAPRAPPSQPLDSGSQGRLNPAPKTPTSQPIDSESQGRMTPAPKTPNLQVDKRLEQVSNLPQFTPGQAESQKRNESTMEEGEIRESSKDLVSSKKCELEASSVAEPNQAFSQDHLEKEKEERQRNQTSNMEDASSAVEGGESNNGLTKIQKQDLLTHEDQNTQGQSKAQKQNSHIVISDDDDAFSAAEGDVKDGKSKEFVSSTSNVPAASGLDGEEMQIDATHEAQTSPSQTKGKRAKDQMYPLENASSTSGGEIREKKMQKLTSSSKVGLEASAMPCISLTESLCNFLDEANTATAPVFGKSPSCHDEEVSGSINSSLLDWATAFDEVSSTGFKNGGADEERVKVGDYMVKEKYVVILLAIKNKYGDIGKNFKVSSTMLQTYMLEGICEIFQGLRIPLKQLSRGNLEWYTSFVKDAIEMGISVEWLETRLSEISESIDVIKECKEFRDAAEMNKEKFENLEKEFGLMEIEKKKGADEIEEIKASLASVTMEIREKKSAMKNIMVKCRNIPDKLLDGLF